MEKTDKTKVILDFYNLTLSLNKKSCELCNFFNLQKKETKSICDEIFASCMLALSTWSEQLLNMPQINISEVLLMLNFQPVSTLFNKSNPELFNKQIKKLFKDFLAKDVFENMIISFQNLTTAEAKFAKNIIITQKALQIKELLSKKVIRPEDVFSYYQIKLATNCDETLAINLILKKCKEQLLKIDGDDENIFLKLVNLKN